MVDFRPTHNSSFITHNYKTLAFIKKYNDQPISDVIKELIAKNNWKSKLYQNKVKEIWLLQMGPSIGSYTKEIKLRGKKLYISISSAPLRQELTYSKTKIIDLINSGLEEEYVTDVIIR